VAVILLVLGIKAFGSPPANRAVQLAAAPATKPVGAAPSAPSVAKPSPSSSPPSRILRKPVPSALPPIKVLGFSGTWLKKHPIADVPAINGRAAIVIDLNAGQILYWQNASNRYPVASLTKMMTAMVALDLAPPDQLVTVSAAAPLVEPSRMGVSAGEQLKVEDLLFGMLLDSVNDAAEALAQGIVDRDRFIQFMNERLAGMHLKDTHFANPTGFDDPGHFSSAYDVAVIAATLLNQYPDLRRIVGTRRASIPATAEHKAFAPYNLDRLLWTYPGAIGVKPGYTDAAGYCLASAAVRDGRTILTVVLGTNQHITDSATLLDFGFRHPVTP
jgi:D-alanyl-D-alanine carboxypeptidase